VLRSLIPPKQWWVYTKLTMTQNTRTFVRGNSTSVQPRDFLSGFNFVRVFYCFDPTKIWSRIIERTKDEQKEQKENLFVCLCGTYRLIQDNFLSVNGKRLHLEIGSFSKLNETNADTTSSQEARNTENIIQAEE